MQKQDILNEVPVLTPVHEGVAGQEIANLIDFIFNPHPNTLL